MTNIAQLIERSHDYVVDMRRHFRMNPELSGAEIQTQRRIGEELVGLGLEPRPIAETGLVADIDGNGAGPTVALRADMDALPLPDEIECDYRSRTPGVAHACGHDGHMAMLLGTARALCAARKEWAGRVRLLFQPAEEKLPGGALLMINEGALDGVDAILGTHLWQPLAAGTIGIGPGPVMAAAGEFNITINGRGGHGSMPHQTIDPILIGAQVVVGLRTILTASVDARETAVLSVGAFNAGAVFNIIPATASILGTVRVFKNSLLEEIFDRIDDLCRGICGAAGATYDLLRISGYPVVVNDPGIAAVVAAAAADVVGPAGVTDMQPILGGEDFARYLEKVPGAFFFTGIGNSAKGADYPHHHSRFDIDEDALRLGCETMVRATLRLLGESGTTKSCFKT
jgi:amidohydrolase